MKRTIVRMRQEYVDAPIALAAIDKSGRLYKAQPGLEVRLDLNGNSVAPYEIVTIGEDIAEKEDK